MKYLLKALLIFFKIQLFAAPLCDMSMSITAINLNWTGAQINETVLMSMQRNSTVSLPQCSIYSYGFTKGNSTTYNRYLENTNGNKINYNIYKSSGGQNILLDVGDVTQNSEAITGSSPDINTIYSNSFDLKLLIDNNIVYPAGTYTDTLDTRLYSNLPLSAPNLEDNSPLNINLTIPTDISVSIVDVGSPFDSSDTTQLMDFGELTTGEIMEADLKVLSNAGHEIFIQSQNGGKIQHLTKPQSKIKYDFLINGSVIKMKKQPKKIISKSGVTPVEGENYRLRVVIGDITGAQTGTYTDFITITAQTNN
jgi:spore coat protein U-like protein